MIAIVPILGGVRATVFAAIAVGALAFSGIQTFRLDRAHATIDRIEKKSAKAQKDYDDKIRKKEQAIADAIAEAAKESKRKEDDLNAEHKRAVARIRAGELHNRFSCPKPSTNPGASPGVDGEERRGLLGEDAEFLVSEARRADLIAIERNELIDIIVALRKELNERVR